VELAARPVPESRLDAVCVGRSIWQADDSDVPMLKNKAHVQFFPTEIKTCLAKGAVAVLGMNECDQPGECDISPADAATLWREQMEVRPG